MKFNWRSNWEILLVLVIIVVGIVITTIVAIRNKDKHMLGLPEETDYSQLMQSPPSVNDLTDKSAPIMLQQADLQAPTSGHFGEEDHQHQHQHQQQQQVSNQNRSRRPTKATRSQVGHRNHQDATAVTMSTTREPSRQQGAHLAPNHQPVDAYDTMSTEPSPSQTPIEGADGETSMTTKATITNFKQPMQEPKRQLDEHATNEPSELMDDFHATRSSLASSSLTKPAGQQQAPVGLYGPYGAPMGHLGQLLMGNMGSKIETLPPDVDDMMTSYSRLANSSITEALLRNYNLNQATNWSSLIDGNTSTEPTQPGQLGTSVAPALTAPTGKAHLATLPISVLLNDLLKLVRPQASQGSDQKTPPAGFLHQLRSFPGPILSLLQLNKDHGNEQVISPSSSHDASESSQHYQRISMASPTDFHSILTRSLSHQGAPLPAYPAPKGVPQNWIAPTMGGTSGYQEAQNENADFVANNAAGFLRGNQIQIPMQSSGPENQQSVQQSSQISQQQQLQQSQTELPYGPIRSLPNLDGTHNENLAVLQMGAPGPFNGEIQQQNHNLIQRQLSNFNQNLNSDRNRISQLHNYMNSRSLQELDQQRALSSKIQSQNLLASHLNGSPTTNNKQAPRGFANLRQAGDVQVPLGYSPPNQPHRVYQGDNFAAGESSLKPTATGSLSSGDNGNIHSLDTKQIPPTRNKVRKKRSADDTSPMRHRKRLAQNNELYNESWDDSRPISVVRPDGRPALDEEFEQRAPPEELTDFKLPVRAMINYRRSLKRARNMAVMEAADSGLMSRLLGTESSHGEELDDDLDGDDGDETSAQERRKEEFDDADLGHEGRRLASKLTKETAPAANQARRNQQRSDIEFYGHPGEETRQLKYGILGSGNYEVVNGGIYPDADESTAAVNSVADYARKPTQLLAALPKLLGAGSQGSHPDAVGGHLGGYLRGASGSSDIVGLVPGQPSGPSSKGLESPLFELIDASGNALFSDPNLLAHLGSSGSSARSTHADGGLEHHQNEQKFAQIGKTKRKHKKQSQRQEILEKEVEQTKRPGDLEGANDEAPDFNDSGRMQHLSSNKVEPETNKLLSSKRRPTSSTNQFNSYQILPSKKVTIFSDQDLDSAPDELYPIVHSTWRRPFEVY